MSLLHCLLPLYTFITCVFSDVAFVVGTERRADKTCEKALEVMGNTSALLVDSNFFRAISPKNKCELITVPRQRPRARFVCDR